MFISPATSAPPPATAETWRLDRPDKLASESEVEASAFSRFVIDRNFLALEGGRLLLKLNQRPTLEVNPLTLECEVIGWDIKIPYLQAADVDRIMARKFSLLFSKADAKQLEEREEKVWLSILDQIDFTAYCINRAAPHYVEGELRRYKPDCIVDWSDGRTERISHDVAASFSELQPGDLFGAYIKLGPDNVALSAERVTVISAA